MDTAVEEKKVIESGGCRAGKATKKDAIVKERIEQALTAFDGLIGKSEILQIDAFLEKGDLIAGKDHLAEEDGFKIVNHALENAYFVPLSQVVKSTPDEMRGIVMALTDGVFQRVQGVTRIVGYYSRVNNWNKSKIGELKDRRIGNYWEKTRTNSEKMESIGE